MQMPCLPPPGQMPQPVMQVAHPVRPAKLVTPDLEAHCEKMTHKGDMIVLEGNVLLLCKKHAQPMRIEAQRVTVNMKDGSFSVEGAGSMTMPAATSFGIMRTSLLELPTNGNAASSGHSQQYFGMQAGDSLFPSPTDRIIRVLPVPPMLAPQELPRTTPPLLPR